MLPAMLLLFKLISKSVHNRWFTKRLSKFLEEKKGFCARPLYRQKWSPGLNTLIIGQTQAQTNEQSYTGSLRWNWILVQTV
jgi:hypothetical protein